LVTVDDGVLDEPMPPGSSTDHTVEVINFAQLADLHVVPPVSPSSSLAEKTATASTRTQIRREQRKRQKAKIQKTAAVVHLRGLDSTIKDLQRRLEELTSALSAITLHKPGIVIEDVDDAISRGAFTAKLKLLDQDAVQLRQAMDKSVKLSADVQRAFERTTAALIATEGQFKDPELDPYRTQTILPPPAPVDSSGNVNERFGLKSKYTLVFVFLPPLFSSFFIRWLFLMIPVLHSN
jgi:hypothetical protein